MLEEFQAHARDLLDACDRVLVPIGEDRAPDRDACHQCGAEPDVRVSMRLGGLEMVWVNSCKGHQEILPPDLAATPPSLP